MRTASSTIGLGRRAVMRDASLAGLGAMLARPALADPDPAQAAEDDVVRSIAGGQAAISPRVRLEIPAVFGNGYSVPMTFSVDSPMTADDHVRRVDIVAPKNPIILVGTFNFTPLSGRAAISTRIRLSEPQYVLAVARMNDGTLLMARSWVKVDTNGCA